MRTTDNNCGKSFLALNRNPECEEKNDLLIIANKTVKELADEEKLLIFPHSLNALHKDVEGSDYVFSLHQKSDGEDVLTTKNIMGFVGCNKTQLTISSRFYTDDGDFFLHYMLHKVFSINVFDLKHKTDNDPIWDFLPYLFPYYLKQALNQGLFKEYQQKEYNDANIKGPIDVARHIRMNYPFMGKIAYRTREHCYDNNITQLVRHTIEYIRVHKFGGGILFNDLDTLNAVNQIIYATPSYEKNSRLNVINKNIRPLNHPYFTEYLQLQKICMQILRQEGLTFGNEKDKVYGLLFDGSWLWEEYLFTVLQKVHFIHPQNKTGEKPIYLFSKDRVERFPDFYKDGLVLDAKYKRLLGKEAEKIDRNDLHQIITYMHVLKSNLGAFIFPVESNKLGDNVSETSLGVLNGFAGELKLYGIPIISQPKEEFLDFCKRMVYIEDQLIRFFPI